MPYMTHWSFLNSVNETNISVSAGCKNKIAIKGKNVIFFVFKFFHIVFENERIHEIQRRYLAAERVHLLNMKLTNKFYWSEMNFDLDALNLLCR